MAPKRWTVREPLLLCYLRAACDDRATILGRRDFVVIVRRWRKQGPVRRPGAWTPIGVVDNHELAAAMAELLTEEAAGNESSVVSADELVHKLCSQDRERILEKLNSRTTGEIQRSLALQAEAAARLAKRERRSGIDRRSLRDRRSGVAWKPAVRDRRSGHDRRSGRDRRAKTAA